MLCNIIESYEWKTRTVAANDKFYQGNIPCHKMTKQLGCELKVENTGKLDFYKRIPASLQSNDIVF